jgi:pimeloyl-ACP methyl ester carboxylesterase
VDLLPHAQFAEIDDCGHCADMEKPQELAALITDFVSEG